jgi:hypothetical protein
MTVHVIVIHYLTRSTHSCRGTQVKIILGELIKPVIKQLMLNIFSAEDEISRLEIQLEFTYHFLFKSESEI